MINIAIILLSIFIMLMLINLFIGRNLPERLMSLCCLTNYVIVLFCFFSLFEGRDSFVDIAYIYALLGFILNLALKKLYESNHD
jgi:multicomponent Na+:H+ antiporter subunit F